MAAIKIAIVAMNELGIIGVNGALPWRIKEEMRHFRTATDDSVVLAGSKTYFSIDKKYRPLENRVNIVLTRNSIKRPILEQEGSYACSSLEKGLELAGTFDKDKIFFIGGGMIYEQALLKNLVDELWISQVNFYVDLSDKTNKEITYFPDFPKEDWQEYDRQQRNQFEVVKYHKKIICQNVNPQ